MEESEKENPETLNYDNVFVPDTSMLEAHIDKRHEQRTGKKESDDFKYSEVFFKPILKIINMILEKTPITELTDKQIKLLCSDFDNLINAEAISPKVRAFIQKISKDKPYLPMALDVSGIVGAKSLEYNTYRKEQEKLKGR